MVEKNLKERYRVLLYWLFSVIFFSFFLFFLFLFLYFYFAFKNKWKQLLFILLKKIILFLKTIFKLKEQKIVL